MHQLTGVLSLFSLCPLHWFYLCRHSNVTTLHCLSVHTLTHTHTHPRLCTTLFTLHRKSVALDPYSWVGDHVTVRFQPTHWHRQSLPSCSSVSKNIFVKILKMYCSCMLQWILNLMELSKSCCYAIKVSVLGWYDNIFHACSVAKLTKLLSVVLFHGGATLGVRVDCQRALHWFRNFLLFLKQNKNQIIIITFWDLHIFSGLGERELSET